MTISTIHCSSSFEPPPPPSVRNRFPKKCNQPHRGTRLMLKQHLAPRDQVQMAEQDESSQQGWSSSRHTCGVRRVSRAGPPTVVTFSCFLLFLIITSTLQLNFVRVFLPFPSFWAGRSHGSLPSLLPSGYMPTFIFCARRLQHSHFFQHSILVVFHPTLLQ